MKQKKQSFFEGAFVLILATVIVKIIGALYKVPLKNLLGAEAMALFTVAYNIYNVALVISTVGLPTALSKMIAEASACGRQKEVRRIVCMGALIFIPIGFVCSALMFLFPESIAYAIGNYVEAGAAVRAISPSVFLVSIISVFRGYFQGMNNMVPTAASQVIEAAGKLGFGLALSYYAMGVGMDVAHMAAFAILGITIGEVLSTAYIVLRAMLKREAHVCTLADVKLRSNREIAKNILMLAIPVTISSAITSITSIIDSKIMTLRLMQLGMIGKDARSVYGVYSTMPFSLWNLPQTLITALTVSLIPTISAAFASRDSKRANDTLASAVRIGILFALPCAAGFITLAGPVLRLLYSKDTVMATPMLQVLSVSIPFVAIVALTNAALQGIGKPEISFVHMFIGAIVKMITEYYLIGIPGVQALGAPLSTILCYVVILVLNLVQVKRLFGQLPSFVEVFCKPLAASVGMGAVAYLVYFAGAMIMPDKIATILAIGIAACVYLVFLLGLKAIRKEDVIMLPKGDAIAKLLRL